MPPSLGVDVRPLDLMSGPPVSTPLALLCCLVGVRHVARRRDRGALSLEMAILFPIVLTVTFGAVQVGLWFEARNMCQAAAEAGVRAGKVLDAPSGAGVSAARSYLTEVANGLVVAPNVTETRTAATIGVTCAGQAQNVIPFPGAHVDITQSSQAGIERFTP